MALFTKVKPISQAQNELIGKKIADIYGILCPRYYIRFIDDNQAEVFSEDLNILGDFENNLVLSISGTNLYDIGNRLALKGYDASQLMPDIFKVYIMDMLFGNHDRSPGNWGMIRIEDEQRLVIFDNEMLFSDSHVPFIFADTEELQNSPSYDAEEVMKARLNDIKTFLFTYDNRYVDIFRKLLFRITPERLERIFDEFEEEYGAPMVDRERKLSQYQKTFTKACEFLEELDMAKGRK